LQLDLRATASADLAFMAEPRLERGFVLSGAEKRKLDSPLSSGSVRREQA
jgi:hypothetical protein